MEPIGSSKLEHNVNIQVSRMVAIVGCSRKKGNKRRATREKREEKMRAQGASERAAESTPLFPADKGIDHLVIS